MEDFHGNALWSRMATLHVVSLSHLNVVRGARQLSLALFSVGTLEVERSHSPVAELELAVASLLFQETLVGLVSLSSYSCPHCRWDRGWCPTLQMGRLKLREADYLPWGHSR